MMFSVPLYFQVTQRVSSTVAGAHLFPAVIGNTVGGIISGVIIRRLGRTDSSLAQNKIITNTVSGLAVTRVLLFQPPCVVFSATA